MDKTPKDTTALAACEFCRLVWGITLLVGTAYLVGWCNWSGWTFLGMLALMATWTCRYCPGHAKYNSKD